MYNEEIIKVAKELGYDYKRRMNYRIKNIQFYFIYDENGEEYIQWKLLQGILWKIEKSKDFLDRILSPIQLIILNEKKPKELKGKKKIATINKDAEWKVQMFIDDNYNLYYQDNHSFVKYNNEGALTGCKCWFKITGLYPRKDWHKIDLLNEINKVSEEQYYKNNVADNVALDRLYGYLLDEYFKYIKEEIND